MATDPHQQAQELAALAVERRRAGAVTDAQSLYAEAAKFERQALDLVPPDKPRTWGIIAVSVGALLYKARAYQEAEVALYSMLARANVLPDTRTQLRELLEAVWDEQTLPAGYEYSGEEIVVALRGGQVGSGTAPLDLVLDKAVEVRSLVTRMVELVAGEKFRRRGPPSPKISQYLAVRATQPAAGSYKFTIKLAAPVQQELFPTPAPTPALVADALFEVIRTAVSESARTRDEMKRLVPDPEYRQAVLKRVRNVIPAGDTVREIELAREWKPAGEAPSRRAAVLLTKESREPIRKVIREGAPQQDPTEEREELRGVLRGVNLDKDWLLVDRPNGDQVFLGGAKETIDDVIGPMVNRKVVVQAVKKKQRLGKTVYLFKDIELDED